MDDLDKILPLVGKGGVCGLVALFAYGLLREYVVPGATLKRELAARDAAHAAEILRMTAEILRMTAELERAVKSAEGWKDVALRALDKGDQIAVAANPRPRKKA